LVVNVHDFPCSVANVVMNGDNVEQIVASSVLHSPNEDTFGTGDPLVQMATHFCPISEDPPPSSLGIPYSLNPIIFDAQLDAPSPSLRKCKKLARRSSNGPTSSLSVVGKRKPGSAKLLANSVPIKKSKAMAGLYTAAMNTLSWNCRGLGNLRTVLDLC
jgi:hypothetical protein